MMSKKKKLHSCLCCKICDQTQRVGSSRCKILQSWGVLYVPTCIHLFPHARTDTIQVVEHEPNFSKFYPLTISFLVSQFCTLESSLCVSSSDYWSCVVWWDIKIVGDVTLASSFSDSTCHHRAILSPIASSLDLFYGLIILLSKYVFQIKIRICLISENY